MCDVVIAALRIVYITTERGVMGERGGVGGEGMNGV